MLMFNSTWYASPSLSWPLLLRSTGSGRAGSAAMAHGPSRSATCGIFPDWGTNPCPLHRQVDSQPLSHQGSPLVFIFTFSILDCSNFSSSPPLSSAIVYMCCFESDLHFYNDYIFLFYFIPWFPELTLISYLFLELLHLIFKLLFQRSHVSPPTLHTTSQHKELFIHNFHFLCSF